MKVRMENIMNVIFPLLPRPTLMQTIILHIFLTYKQDPHQRVLYAKFEWCDQP